MPIDGYTINGTAFGFVGTGPGGALEVLGYTESGVDKSITYNRAEIITDLYGPMTPQDFQDMGMTAQIRFPFIAIDRTVLAKVMGAGDAGIGLINTPGRVIGVSGYGIPLVIGSKADFAWSFPTTILRNESTRLATKANPDTLEFFAWPFLSYLATTGKGATLWTRPVIG